LFFNYTGGILGIVFSKKEREVLKKKQSLMPLVFSGICILSFQGCDQISSFFNPSRQKNTEKHITKPAVEKDSIDFKASPALMHYKGEKVPMSESSGIEIAQAKRPTPSVQSSQPQSSPTPEAKQGGQLGENELARVGDWVLTVDEFKQRLEALKELVPDYNTADVEQNKLILDELVRQQLVVQEAEKSGLAKKKEIVQAVEEFRRTIIVQEVANQITSEISATEEEAKEYYEKNKADFVEPGQWRIREIMVETEEEAKDIQIKLLSGGADFETMVKERSKSQSAWQKGDLGYLSEFAFPKMEAVVKALEIGQVSNVFKGPEGYYIVKLEDKKGGESKAFDEIKQEIIDGLTFLKRQEAIAKYLQSLQEKIKVEVNESLLEK
jgi:peptidyl-prolyl cis-trans isomerase C